MYDNPVYKTAKETLMYRTVLWTLWERVRGMIWENDIETCIISYKKRMASPGSMQNAWGWCTGMTQRDGMGREVGGGSGLGTRVHPWQIQVAVWQNQYNIVK